MQAAVAGVPEGVPVNFINQKHRATRGCWTRVTRRPDKSWARRLYGRSKDTSRHELMKPIWKAFERRVRDMARQVLDQYYNAHLAAAAK